MFKDRSLVGYVQRLRPSRLCSKIMPNRLCSKASRLCSKIVGYVQRYRPSRLFSKIYVYFPEEGQF